MILALLFLGIAFWGFISFLTKKPKANVNQSIKTNPYIQFHNAKIKNDQNYQAYLHWCQRNGEIPMDKKVFLKEVEDKENQIKKLLK